MSDESKLCARLIVAKQPTAMRNLSVQWVDGLRGSVTKRRDTAAKFLAQLKNQSGDYAKAHHAVIAECDKMLSANEMAESRADRLGAEEEATGRVICNDCGGYLMFKCEGNTIRVFHDCYTGKHSRESFRKLIEENAELRKRCEAYEMLNLGLQEMLDAKACPDCHKQNS